MATIYLSLPVQTGAPKWGNYPRGVVAGFLAKGIHPGGLDVLLHSTVQLGSGLGSSAALEVCTATLLEAVTGVTLDPVEKALLCQKAEHDFRFSPCGWRNDSQRLSRCFKVVLTQPCEAFHRAREAVNSSFFGNDRSPPPFASSPQPMDDGQKPCPHGRPADRNDIPKMLGSAEPAALLKTV